MYKILYIQKVYTKKYMLGSAKILCTYHLINFIKLFFDESWIYLGISEYEGKFLSKTFGE